MPSYICTNVGTVSVLLYFFCYLFLSSARDVCITPIVWLFFCSNIPGGKRSRFVSFFLLFSLAASMIPLFSCIHGCGFCPVLSRFGWLLSSCFLSFFLGAIRSGRGRFLFTTRIGNGRTQGFFFSFDSVFDSGELAPFPPVF